MTPSLIRARARYVLGHSGHALSNRSWDNRIFKAGSWSTGTVIAFNTSPARSAAGLRNTSVVNSRWKNRFVAVGLYSISFAGMAANTTSPIKGRRPHEVNRSRPQGKYHSRPRFGVPRHDREPWPSRRWAPNRVNIDSLFGGTPGASCSCGRVRRRSLNPRVRISSSMVTLRRMSHYCCCLLAPGFRMV
jgi:hypothetical protein